MRDFPLPHAAADRNLLFGILAVQMDFVAASDLIAAMQAWVLNKSKPLGGHLLEAGALAAETHALIQALVDKHIEQHGGRIEHSLAALSSVEPLRRDLAQIADADVQTSLARAGGPPPRGDRHATLAAGQPHDLPAGERFRILRPHASGGLGKVSVARDAELNREVALKELHDRHADNLDSRARFLQEAEITGGLEHPGVVPIYGLGQYADGRPFYAMRFIRGDTLAQAIDRFHREADPKWSQPAAVLHLRRLLGRLLDVCNAMEYAHSRGVLHRDLKPGNIMLGQYGETLVVDWGLAKPLGAGGGDSRSNATDATLPINHEPVLTPQSGSGSAPTVMGSAVGTPAFMSPEQAAGRLDQLGPASDVFSLGATLYVLLTGRSPQQDDDLGVVLQRVQRGEFPAPRAVNAAVPRGLETLEQMGHDRSAVTLVLNRADSDVGITQADVEELLGRTPDVLVDSERAIPRALTNGEPIVVADPKSKAARSYGLLAARCLAATARRTDSAAVVAAPTPNGNGLRRLLLRKAN